MSMNSNDILLRKIALKTAYNKNLLTLQTFNQEMAVLSELEERINSLEEKRRHLIKEAKRKISQDLATV